MSLLFGNRWLLVLILWTGLIAVGIVLNLPGATREFPPCDYGTDPSLEDCPADAVNVDALWIVVLAVLWVGGVVVEGAAFAVWWFWRELARRGVSPPRPR
jgi:hypothetical protein